MRIFLDIGAHLGQTVEVALQSQWAFDRIVSFEPAPKCWDQIVSRGRGHAELCRFGLWHEDAEIELHNAGEVGASVSDIKDARMSETVRCNFRDAATWFAENIAEADEVYAKMNIEGAEAEVVDRLFQTGHLRRIDHLLIHFDVRKIPGKEPLEGRIREQLRSSGVQYLSADEIQFGGVYRGTENWLSWCQSSSRFRDLRFRKFKRFEHKVRRQLFPLRARLGAGLRVTS